MRASLALLRVDATQVDYLYGRLLDAAPNEVVVIRDALAPHQDALLEKLWTVVLAPEKGKEAQRLRAAAALAKYDPENQKWAKAVDPVVNQLVVENPVFLSFWMEGFRPIKAKLQGSLANIYRDANRRESERSLATNLLAVYAADQPQLLADLLMDADEKQFAVLYPVAKSSVAVAALLTQEVDKQAALATVNTTISSEKLARRQANAAVALLRLNHPDKVWPLLKHSPDPRVRTYLIHRFGPLGAEAGSIVKRLDEETDVTILRALILSLGEFDAEALPLGKRGLLVEKLQKLYRTADDAGLHAAAEWLLRQWQQEAWLRQTNEAWQKNKETQQKRLEQIEQVMARGTKHWRRRNGTSTTRVRR